jgi:phosphoethanolamine N-methyltransferase
VGDRSQKKIFLLMNEMDQFYHDDRLARLQLVWGEGYLSPGGDEDVRSIVKGVPLEGRRVLDIGCGVGGPSMLLAEAFGAQVTAVDVSKNVLLSAKALARSRGLTDRIEFKVTEPGPLPFSDGSFDAVFTKDAMTHIEDKHSLFSEVLRVLMPGGHFLASDWLYSEDADQDPALRKWMGDEADAFKLDTIDEIADLLVQSGFTEVKWLEDRDLLLAAAESGAVRPAHLKAKRPHS